MESCVVSQPSVMISGEKVTRKARTFFTPAKKLKRSVCHPYTKTMMIFISVLVCLSSFPYGTNAEANSDTGETTNSDLQGQSNYMDSLPSNNENIDAVPLSRERRSASNESSDKSVWEEIDEFYSEDQNMATYCVLPIMILVYGGCSAIYCIHKCRQYIRRRKHRRLKEDDCDSINSDKNDLNQTDKVMCQDSDRPISQISQAWTDFGDTNDNIKWTPQTEANLSDSPLPWQVPEQTAAAAMLGQTDQNARSSHASDKMRDDITLEEGRVSSRAGMDTRASSRMSTLDDALMEEEMRHGSKTNNTEALRVVAATAAMNSDDFGESSDDHPNLPPQQKYMPQQQQFFQQHRQEQVKKHRLANNANDESRIAANLSELTSRTSKTKATDYSRFAEAKPIEIVPLTADPSLRVWDPLHRRMWGEKNQPRSSSKIQPIGEACDRESVNQMKEEMMARYDALSTFQMAKKAAEILKTNAVEKSPFQRKPNKKKHIFIAE